jgi:hypothetical protein
LVAALTAPPRTVDGGYLAATVGGPTGAASGAWVGWEMVLLLDLEGDPNLGPAHLAFGLARLSLVVGGGMAVGALVGVSVALRVVDHRGIVATVAATVALAAAVGALLVYLAAPLAVAAPLLAGVPAAARLLVIATVRRRARGSRSADRRHGPAPPTTDSTSSRGGGNARCSSIVVMLLALQSRSGRA